MSSFHVAGLFPLSLLLPCSAWGQGLVVHAPMDRTVLLEEFSAIHCGNCPAAHVLADQLVADHPGEVVAAEVHGGALSVPDTGEPDLRNSAATALWAFYSVSAQPKGLVDRRAFGGQTVLSTGTWSNAVSDALQLASPMNIGVASAFEPATRTLTVNVELYYTADGSGGNDHISVFLKEDHIVGYQQDYVNGPQAAYDHNDVLRGYVTDLWGDEVLTSTAGTTVMRTYTFNVPVEWDIANCAVVAFVGEYQGEIYQVREVAADGGTTLSVMDAFTMEVGNAYPDPASQLLFIPYDASSGPADLQVMDGAGRWVGHLRIVAGPGVIAMDVLDLANGSYTYRLVSPRGTRTGRFVVQH